MERRKNKKKKKKFFYSKHSVIIKLCIITRWKIGTLLFQYELLEVAVHGILELI